MIDSPDRTPGIRARATWGRRLDISARYGFPAVLTIVLMLLTRLPSVLPQQAVLLPALTIASVWFWSLYRADAMPPPIVFVLGVLLDLLGYVPLGSGTLTLLLVHGIAARMRARLIKAPFLVVWLAFAPLALGAAMLGWLLLVVLTVRLLPVTPVVLQAMITLAVYPVLDVILARAHRVIAEPGHA